MSRHRSLLVIICIALGAVLLADCGGDAGSTTTANRLVAIGAGLRGPAGLRATRFATGLQHAAAFAFDDQGRLWVATAAYQDDGTDGVYLVASEGATPVRVITGVHTPLGLLWYQGSLYVSSKDRVDAYRGFDGTRFTSVRTILTLPAGNGENNQITLSPDGRMLLGISAPCDHCTPKATTTAAILSFAPDGSDVRVYASGIRAAIGLAYYPGTSDLFVTMNQRDDLGKDAPGDWLAVVREGDDWGFPQCYGQTTKACAAVPSATAVLDAHAAVSGVAIVTGQLGGTVGTSAVVAEWAKGKVQRVVLRRRGSHYLGSVEPFLQGMKNPEPVALSPSGTLLVGDWTTGTVYAIAPA